MPSTATGMSPSWMEPNAMSETCATQVMSSFRRFSDRRIGGEEVRDRPEVQRVDDTEEDHQHQRDGHQRQAGEHGPCPTDRCGLLPRSVLRHSTAILSFGTLIRAIVFDFDGLILDTE